MAPDDYIGYWDPATATIDWCEKNYEVSYYVAEFWNTVSNIAFIVSPLISFFELYHQKVKLLYLLPLLYLSFTGIGSLFFHMTLKYPMQLWDELAMIWEGLLILYIFIYILDPMTAKKFSTKLIIIAYGISLKLIYILLMNKPIFFQLGFAFIHYIALFLGYRVTRTRSCSPRLYWYGVLFNHLAFLIWNIDNIFCTQLESLRSNMPKFLKPATQFHAVWHILAGYGTYFVCLFTIHSLLITDKRFFKVTFSILTVVSLRK